MIGTGRYSVIVVYWGFVGIFPTEAGHALQIAICLLDEDRCSPPAVKQNKRKQTKKQNKKERKKKKKEEERTSFFVTEGPNRPVESLSEPELELEPTSISLPA